MGAAELRRPVLLLELLFLLSFSLLACPSSGCDGGQGGTLRARVRTALEALIGEARLGFGAVGAGLSIQARTRGGWRGNKERPGGFAALAASARSAGARRGTGT
jgi:hypothetical protein